MAEKPEAKVSPTNKVMLISIDGWGHSTTSKGNGISNAKTPEMSSMEKNNLHTKVEASGYAVGLPKGLMGNSEVGHLTMGAGRVQFQDLERINAAIDEKTFFTNEVTLKAFAKAKQGTGRVHFLGLISDGGVHSHINHLKSFLEMAKAERVPNCYVHFFADGRDTPPTSAPKYIEELLAFFKQLAYPNNGVQLATIIGRFYAMDRDTRWERIKVAYEALCEGVGEVVATGAEGAVETVLKRHAAGEKDEFLKPIILHKDGLIKDDDVLIFIDFRSDRMREICETFGVKRNFETSVKRKVELCAMTKYDETFPFPIIFPPQNMSNVLAEWLSKYGVRQFHTAETEKYAHVTFFFNGGREAAFQGEDRVLVPSPKVATYDLAPTMSVNEVGEEVIKALAKNVYPFVMCNLAPPDMVGHTGVYDATVTAVEATDVVVGRIAAACKKHGYILVVTSDHGNAEEMFDEHGGPKTSHTSNLVPLNIVCDASQFELVSPSGRLGGLGDVAPTVLTLMGLPVPKEMTGQSLVACKNEAKRLKTSSSL